MRYLFLTRFMALCLLTVVPAAAQDISGNLPLGPAWSVSAEEVWPTGGYTEGPVFDENGNLFISFPRSGRVERLSPSGEEMVWRSADPGANGHLVLEDGTHLLATQPEVLHLSAEGDVLRSVSGHDGQAFAFPNDLALDGRGGFFFTDSGSRTEATGAVFHVDGNWATTRVASGLAFPNGIIRSGTTLYVSQSQGNDILAFRIAGAELRDRRTLLTLPAEGLDQAKNAPDGMCMDPDGTLFVTHNGMGRIHAVSPRGELLASYRTGLLTNSNCTFGPDGALYVTGSRGFETGPGAVVRLALP